MPSLIPTRFSLHHVHHSTVAYTLLRKKHNFWDVEMWNGDPTSLPCDNILVAFSQMSIAMLTQPSASTLRQENLEASILNPNPIYKQLFLCMFD